MSAGAIALVLIGLALADGRVRTQIAQPILARPSATIAEAGGAARDAIEILAVAVRDQSLAHAPLATFALAGGVLLLFMLRT
jgi:hypothetical protein